MLVNHLFYDLNNNSISFFYNKYYLKFDGIDIGDIYETFINEAYSYLKVKDKIIVDIGANIGDTAIYFAIKGARKVISLEPYLYIFNIGKKNLQDFLTNYPEFMDKIEFINAGYGEDKEIKIDTSFIPNNGSEIKESENGTNINLYSLKTLVNKYNIDSGILKMDCEGCEYSLLNEDDEIIKKFSMIQIEYHYGYDKLVDKLRKCGFNIKYTEPQILYNKSVDRTLILGYIYAEN
ncbi:MAG: FkbM family methyltransferase [Candidatus Micrarchaeaceae archaeon]